MNEISRKHHTEYFEDEIKRHYSGNKIKAKRTNFIFFNNGTMRYNIYLFDSYLDALIDAIKQGEDMDDMISLIFPEKVDHPIVKARLNFLMNE